MKLGTAIAIFVVGAALGIFFIASFGFIDLKWPWEGANQSETEFGFDGAAEEPSIVAVEPIMLDCRARIRAEIPVEAKKRHKLAGATYRTDTVQMLAVGDVDTCVNSGDVEIANRDDGTVDVIIPAESIEFSRPRVDAIATADSVEVDVGFIGELAELLPGVSDGDGMTPAAYAFAQTVIGGSDCMEEAFHLTEQVLEEVYTDSYVDNGGDPANINVYVTGTPDYGQNELPADDPAFEDFEFSADVEAGSCKVAPEAYGDGDTGEAAPTTEPSG